MVQEKETQKVKKSSGLSYAFATFALLIVFAIGMSVLDNYEKLSYMEQEVKSLTSQVSAISDTSTNTQTSTTPSDGVITSNMGDSNDSDIGVESGVIGSDTDENVADTTEENSNEMTVEDLQDTTEDAEIATQTMSIEGKQAYIVEQGDTLEIISMKIYQTTDKVDEIRELNQIEDVNKILVGEKIWLP